MHLLLKSDKSNVFTARFALVINDHPDPLQLYPIYFKLFVIFPLNMRKTNLYCLLSIRVHYTIHILATLFIDKPQVSTCLLFIQKLPICANLEYILRSMQYLRTIQYYQRLYYEGNTSEYCKRNGKNITEQLRFFGGQQ